MVEIFHEIPVWQNSKAWELFDIVDDDDDDDDDDYDLFPLK